jgi:MerR family transcriptional regulator/heat shock protein HspR
MNSNNKPLFTLSIAAEIIGVHQRTLMLYENEDLVIPHRTKTNRRRYSPVDIDKLRFVQYLTRKEGLNLAGVRTMFKILDSLGDQKEAKVAEIFPDFHLPLQN